MIFLDDGSNSGEPVLELSVSDLELVGMMARQELQNK